MARIFLRPTLSPGARDESADRVHQERHAERGERGEQAGRRILGRKKIWPATGRESICREVEPGDEVADCRSGDRAT